MFEPIESGCILVLFIITTLPAIALAVGLYVRRQVGAMR